MAQHLTIHNIPLSDGHDVRVCPVQSTLQVRTGHALSNITVMFTRLIVSWLYKPFNDNFGFPLSRFYSWTLERCTCYLKQCIVIIVSVLEIYVMFRSTEAVICTPYLNMYRPTELQDNDTFCDTQHESAKSHHKPDH